MLGHNPNAPTHRPPWTRLYARTVAVKESYISIVIPVHESKTLNPNFEDYVYEIIESGQELIVVVDQCPNGTLDPKTIEVIERISKTKDRKLKIHKGQYGSPGTARNCGKAEATGEWIYFWDADDCPNLSEALLFVHQLDRKSADMGIASAELIFPNENTLSIGSRIRDIVEWPGLWRMTFKAELIENIEFENWDWCEDQDFILKALGQSHLAISTDASIYKYFVQVPNSSTSTTSNWKSIPQFIESLKSRIKNKSGSKLDYLFFIKNLYSLRKYLTFLSWVRNAVSILPLILFVIRLDTPRIVRLRGLGSSL